MRFSIKFLLATMLLASLTACNKKNFSSKPVYQFSTTSGNPNFADLHFWAAHPGKWDPSDSIPEPLRKDYIKDTSVDVFFIYPTSLTDYKDTSWNATIDDADLNSKTDYSSILYQASVFNASANVYAPRYRQAHLRAFNTDDKKRADAAFTVAYDDVKKAFEFYLTHYNHGKPIIIASHSQGTLHAAHLLKEFFDNKPLQKQLVCAYIIGLPVKANQFSTIKPCADSSKTSCFVSWRTYEEGYEGEPYIAREKFTGVNINPLSFRWDSTYVDSKMNIGGMIRNFNKLIPGLTDAQVHGKILWASKPKFFGNIFLNFKNYHIADYNLFWSNIRADVKRRIDFYKDSF